jgi:hypothetical protein
VGCELLVARGTILRTVARRVAGGSGNSNESSGHGAAARGQTLSFEDDRDRRRKTDIASQPDVPEIPRTRKKRGSSPEVGQALRAAYQQAVSEDIPPEMLDLLGKLG